VVRLSGRLSRDRAAQGLVEYTFILVLVVVVCLAAVMAIGEKTGNSVSNFVNTMP